MTSRLAAYVYPVATIVAILVVWELAARLGYVPRYILPSPTGIAIRFYELHALILKESLFTLQATLLGFVLSVVVGVPHLKAPVGGDSRLHPDLAGSALADGLDEHRPDVRGVGGEDADERLGGRRSSRQNAPGQSRGHRRMD